MIYYNVSNVFGNLSELDKVFLKTKIDSEGVQDISCRTAIFDGGGRRNSPACPAGFELGSSS